jgi:DNA-binding CsgD family transcriptional regulator
MARLATDEIHLSPRQAQIVSLIAQGRSDKEIALTLGLSTATVRTYLQRMYRQYGSRSRAHLVAIAWHDVAHEEHTDPKPVSPLS